MRSSRELLNQQTSFFLASLTIFRESFAFRRTRVPTRKFDSKESKAASKFYRSAWTVNVSNSGKDCRSSEEASLRAIVGRPPFIQRENKLCKQPCRRVKKESGESFSFGNVARENLITLEREEKGHLLPRIPEFRRHLARTNSGSDDSGRSLFAIPSAVSIERRVFVQEISTKIYKKRLARFPRQNLESGYQSGDEVTIE